jgi:alanine racemase
MGVISTNSCNLSNQEFYLNSSILEINISTIKENTIRTGLLTGPETEIVAVIKADAYGLGAAGVAQALLEGGASLLAVARCSEALEVNRILPDLKTDILIMGLCSDDELKTACLNDFNITIDSLRQAQILSVLAVSHSPSGKAAVHIKLNTGFNRIGLKVTDPASMEEYKKICSLPGLEIKGIYSHLTLISREEDEKQFSLFQNFTEKISDENLPVGKKHICDSIGLARYPDYRMNMVRAGAILYGMKPFRAPLIDKIDLEFPLRWICPIIKITHLDEGERIGYDDTWTAPEKGALIATLPVGYADGYHRSFSGKAEVLINGHRCPVAGLICMDQTMVDISGIKGVSPGDPVTLLGKDADSNEITILEMAQWAQTNRNEILTSIGRRVVRKYYKNGLQVAELNYLDSPSYKRVNNEQ